MCPLEILITVKLIGEEKFYQDNYHNVEHMIYWLFMKFPVIINNYPKIHHLILKIGLLVNAFLKNR